MSTSSPVLLGNSEACQCFYLISCFYGGSISYSVNRLADPSIPGHVVIPCPCWSVTR